MHTPLNQSAGLADDTGAEVGKCSATVDSGGSGGGEAPPTGTFTVEPDLSGARGCYPSPERLPGL